MQGKERTREALQTQAGLTHFPPFAVTAVQQGMERRLQQGDWQRERPFLLTLAVRAFPSVTDIPLKSSVSPLHTSVRSKGCRSLPPPRRPGRLLLHGLCRDPAQPPQTQQYFSSAVGTSSVKLLPHSTLRAHKWEKLVMRRGKHRD